MFHIQHHCATRFVLLGLAATTVATPALAQSAIRVDYSDLNLHSRAGAQVMLGRLNAAARRACGPAPDIRALGRYSEYSACLKETLSKSVAALKGSLVTAAHDGTGATSQDVETVDAPR